MSIDTCADCGNAIDTDFDAECYLANYSDRCVCEACRDKYFCEECGSDETHDAHHEGDMSAPECHYRVCEECGHQFNHG